tara:strand:- start:340 stop:1107 length:768 start_codon:yes stop_codon:yes gene_type:complete
VNLNKTKTALCFSGKLGEWRNCAESVLQNLILPLKPDIFLSTWDDESYQDFAKHYKPKKINISNYEKTKPLIKKSISDCPQNVSAGLLPMLYNMEACNRLCSSYSKINKIKYDLVIRLRPDILILEQIKKHEIEDCIKNKLIRLPYFESSNIYNHKEELKKEFAFSFVYDKASLPRQINDQLAIGPPKEMEKYMLSTKEIKKSINFLWNEGYPEYMLGVAESILTTHLNLNNCKYKQLTGTGDSGNIKIRLARND